MEIFLDNSARILFLDLEGRTFRSLGEGGPDFPHPGGLFVSVSRENQGQESFRQGLPK